MRAQPGLPDLVIVTLCMIIAATVMFSAASRYTVFDDEAFSAQRYALPVGELLGALRQRVEPDPPLYYLCIGRWCRWFGLGPVGLRSFSIVCFLISIPIMWLAARSWLSVSAARYAVVLTALHPLHLFFGFAARWYSLMHLWVLLLIWLTGLIVRQLRAERTVGLGWYFVWGGVATAMWYTNYFAPAVIGLLWIVGLWYARRSSADLGGWLAAAGLALICYVPWWSVFTAELLSFPQGTRAWSGMTSSAARLLIALSTGNLADPGMLRRSDPGAWWVWIPMVGFGALVAWRALVTLQRIGALAFVACGSVAAGVMTATMIDKYAMIVSGPVVLVVAAVLSNTSRRREARSGRLPLVMCSLLVAAWLGCAINWIRGDDWSSLRWIDPFPQVLRSVHADWREGDVLIATHPSVGYYWSLMRGGDGAAEYPDRWLEGLKEVYRPAEIVGMAIARDQGTRRVWVIETAAIGSDAEDQSALGRQLEDSFRLVERETFLRDPAATRKNQIDPRYHHPEYRIVRYRYER